MAPASAKNLLHVVGIGHKSLGRPHPMRSRPLLTLFFSLTLGTSAALAQEAVGLEQAFPDLSFSLPVAISPMPGSKDVVFVLEKGDPAPSPESDKSTDGK